ncbi:ABC transporter [Altererythrobacter salegens]|uniref:ABC transporter n=1 Tax=Croceibacterium salegens TaxID=1737568 RepID=A0A6I4SSS4_9SPHN|nr:ABC transporter [Croceibacterium salegens]MXO58037.1 ABC transporter [Croceibacterium salegens]
MAGEAEQRPVLGLMGTVPIYWGEAGGIDDVLADRSEQHWARPVLESGFTLHPIDYLDADALAGVDDLLLAQPRALSGEENVALDAWVRAGGHLLLFADPMMTGHSRFALGDRRRPQDVTLLSPILTHWGLAMDFDPDEMPQVELVEADGIAIPVNLPGRLALQGESPPCRISAARVLAQCAIGAGSATILADAALLDLHDPESHSASALQALVSLAFASTGENTGR